MKLFNLYFIIIFLLTTTLFSQKINLDKERASIYFVQLPKDPILDKAKRTYSIKSDAKYFEEKIKLSGFTKKVNDGTIRVKVTLNDVVTTPVTISKQIKEEKDRDGNVTSTKTFYQAAIQYTFSGKCFVDVKEKDKSSFSLEDKGEIKSKSTNSLEYAKSYFPKNYEVLIEKAKKEFIKEENKFINDKLNSLYGYPTDLREQIFWILDSKKNPDYAGYQKQKTRIKEVFLRMKANQPITSTHTQYLDDFETYFNQLVEDYPLDDKKHTKMRYASYFNLAQLYYNFDMPDKTILYANKIIENGYHKSDGKKFIKRANKLKELFAKNKLNSTHFNVKTVDNLTYSTPKNNQIAQKTIKKESSTPNKKQIAKPKNRNLNTILKLTGDTEKDNLTKKRILKDIEVAYLVFRDFGFMFEGEYIEENNKILGKKYYSLNDDKYETASLIIENGSILGAKIKSSKLTLVFKNRVVNKMKAKSLSNFDYTFYRDNEGKVKKIENPFSNGRIQLIDFSYETGKMKTVTKYIKKGKFEKKVTTILKKTPDTFNGYLKVYPYNSKDFSELRKATASKLDKNTFTIEKVFKFGEKKEKKKITNLEYTNFNKIKMLSEENNDLYNNLKNYEYRNEKLAKVTQIESENKKMFSKNINIYFNLKENETSLPDYEWKKGRYIFNASNELNYVERDGKHRKKENGTWTDWKYNKM